MWNYQFIEFITYSGALLTDPLLKVGELFAVGLGTMNGHEDRYAKYEREDFQARFLGGCPKKNHQAL